MPFTNFAHKNFFFVGGFSFLPPLNRETFHSSRISGQGSCVVYVIVEVLWSWFDDVESKKSLLMTSKSWWSCRLEKVCVVNNDYVSDVLVLQVSIQQKKQFIKQ